MGVKKRKKTLASGRPPATRPRERMTSERSRTIIRAHHRMHKEHAAALKRGDSQAAQDIMKSIERNGGLKMYQAASKQGQARDRGGDSSKILVDWLQQAGIMNTKPKDQRSDLHLLRCLEIGALSAENHISKFPFAVHMTRIDLNSQGSGIEKQDFMERPLPLSDDDKFDIISLSLVLNYVPEPVGRGAMLERLTRFLRRHEHTVSEKSSKLPVLFFVLPLPCVANSRYLDESLLLQIMKSFGFEMLYSKDTSKLCYYLFNWTGGVAKSKFGKIKIRDGPAMNNFCIILE